MFFFPNPRSVFPQKNTLRISHIFFPEMSHESLSTVSPVHPFSNSFSLSAGAFGVPGALGCGCNPWNQARRS